MKGSGIKFLNVLLGITLVFFVISAVLILNNPRVTPTSAFYAVCLYVQILAGAFAIFWSLKKTKLAYQLLVGMVFFSWGFLLLLILFCFTTSINIWWPVFGITTGIEICIAGMYKYKKIKFGYLFPSCCLIIIDLWYMLFSFQIIKVPFSKVVKYSCPAFFGVVAVCLISFFVLQQKHKNLVIKDEEQGTFSDEEIHLEDD